MSCAEWRRGLWVVGYVVRVPCALHWQVDEVYKLLSENYVEDDDNMFRFDYSRDFLQWYAQRCAAPRCAALWHAACCAVLTGGGLGLGLGLGCRALKPPGYRLDWHIGVRSSKSKNLLAFITGIPANVRVYKRYPPPTPTPTPTPQLLQLLQLPCAACCVLRAVCCV